MLIETPTKIQTVAWEGELVAPESLKASGSERLPVSLGQPEIWPAAEALETEVGRKWVPPLRNAEYWLLRLACTLRKPGRFSAIIEAQQTLVLRPQNSGAAPSATYAFSLFPERLTAEDKGEFSIGLGPELTFGGLGVKAGELGATIGYRKVFPVIQSYGAGESVPYWIFKPHASYPLEGSQFVYAVVVSRAGANGIQASVEFTVTVDTQFGPLRLGLPDEAKVRLRFRIPQVP